MLKWLANQMNIAMYSIQALFGRLKAWLISFIAVIYSSYNKTRLVIALKKCYLYYLTNDRCNGRAWKEKVRHEMKKP
jgi:hypothetical protein